MHHFTLVAPSLSSWEPHLFLVRWSNLAVNPFTWLLRGRVRTQTPVCLTSGSVLYRLLGRDRERIAWVGAGGLFRDCSSEEGAGSPNDHMMRPAWWYYWAVPHFRDLWEQLAQRLPFSLHSTADEKQVFPNYFSLLILKVLDILFWNTEKYLHGVERTQAVYQRDVVSSTSSLRHLSWRLSTSH